MEIKSFKTDTQIDLLLIDPDGDNETLSGGGVDMAGYDGVIFLAAARRGEAADIVLKAQQDSASNFGGAQDLTGTSVTMSIATGTDGFCGVEIKSPRERYVRP